MRNPIEKQINTLGWALHAVGVLTTVLTVGAFVEFGFMPFAEQQELCDQRIAQLESMLAKASQVQSEHHNRTVELASLKESVVETQRRLPSEMREHEFLDQVRAAASATGVELGEYRLGAIVELASYSKADLTFECHGSFASICQFLNKIDHLARITEISNLQMETTDNFNRYPLQVTFVLYFGGATHDRSMRGEVL